MEKHPVLKWVDKTQRRRIMKEVGITSDAQVYNVLRGESVNYTLLEKLVEQAERNKELDERIKKLKT